MASDLIDTYFISHGSPMLSVNDSLPARGFLKSWQQNFMPAKPRAILIASAHWETDDPTVGAVDGRYDTIHDFNNFPEALYKLEYPAPGAADLAKRAQQLLREAGFVDVKRDRKRGLDHGAWVPLMLMYPEADVPVCHISVQPHLDGTHHYNVGKALVPLRDEGVLIIGSGSATHNLRVRARGVRDEPIFPWALDFDNWLRDALLDGRYEDVNHYDEKAPQPNVAHPEPEHFYPLHVALGAGGEKSKAELIHQSWEDSSLSYSSYRFTT